MVSFQALFDKNECFASFFSNYESTCENYELKFNKTSEFTYEDHNLISFNSYEYKLCVANTFDKTCNSKVVNVKTNMSLPSNFSYFNYEILGNSHIYLYWNSPLKLNGKFVSYILYRNEKEIYSGTNNFFNDETREIQPYKIYKYEIQFCNEVGCIFNEKTLLISTLDRLPEQLETVYYNITNASIVLTFKYPFKPNGLIERCVLNVKELEAEILIRFDFETDKISQVVSAKQTVSEVNLSASTIFNKKIAYTVSLIDLIASTEYSVKLMCCNKAGCVRMPSSLSRYDFTTITTSDFFVFNLKTPVVYVIDDSTTEIVWQEPVTKLKTSIQYKLTRNNVEIAHLNQSNLRNQLGFLSYTDSNLTKNSFFSYKLQATSNNYAETTPSVLVQTSPAKFDYNCNSGGFSHNYSNITIYNAQLLLLNVLFVNFTVKSSNQIAIEYRSDEWKSFISCISRLNYQSTDLNDTLQLDKSAFSIKILLENNANGLQSLDFPYPAANSPNYLNTSVTVIKYFLTGLSAFSNYSLRISFSSNYPTRQILTTNAIYLQTFEDAPCCTLKPPTVVKHPFSRTFSVRWSLPDSSNGMITHFILVRSKLKGRGCFKIKSSEINSENIEKQIRYELFPLEEEKNPRDSFLYDTTNGEFIYKDTDSVLLESFAYFSYKVIAVNSKGSLESEWCQPLHSWQLLKPSSPPLDLKITEAYSTGFKLKFKEPEHFNGILSFYTVKIKELATVNIIYFLIWL